MGVGNYLAEILTETYGYQVLHVTEEFDLAGGVLDRNKAYDYARPYIEQILKENPSIEVVIDLHRDGVAEDRHLVTEINGKPTAQIMFLTDSVIQPQADRWITCPIHTYRIILLFLFRWNTRPRSIIRIFTEESICPD